MEREIWEDILSSFTVIAVSMMYQKKQTTVYDLIGLGQLLMVT